MVVVREPVTAEMMSPEVMSAPTNVVEGWGRSEAAAAKMHTASMVAAAAEMHATAAVATAAKMHAATVATAAEVTATMTAAVAAAHLRGQALRDLLGHTRVACIDQ